MEILSVKVSNRYQLIVLKQALKQLPIKDGCRLLVDIQDGMLILMPKPKNYTLQLAGLHREIWEKSGEYLNSERDGWSQ